LGNQTHKDHFKLLQMDGSSLLIGARNVIYNLSINDLSENVEQVGPFVSLIISSFMSSDISVCMSNYKNKFLGN
jgi:hypothetical protein